MNSLITTILLLPNSPLRFAIRQSLVTPSIRSRFARRMFVGAWRLLWGKWRDEGKIMEKSKVCRNVFLCKNFRTLRWSTQINWILAQKCIEYYSMNSIISEKLKIFIQKSYVNFKNLNSLTNSCFFSTNLFMHFKYKVMTYINIKVSFRCDVFLTGMRNPVRRVELYPQIY